MSGKHRVKAAGVTLLLACIVGGAIHAVYQGMAALVRMQAEGDVTRLYHERYADVVGALPARGVFGYVSDATPGDITWYSRFYLTQYVLSPRVLVRGAVDRPRVVADFRDAARARAAAGQFGLAVLADAGNGIAIWGPMKGTEGATEGATATERAAATAPATAAGAGDGTGAAQLAASLAAFVTPAALGWLSVAALVPVRGRWPTLLTVALAMPAGAGACSLAAFAWLAIVGRPTGYVTAESAAAVVVVVVAAGLAMVRRRRRRHRAEEHPVLAVGGRAGGNVVLAAAVALACGAVVGVAMSIQNPHGEWDAWMIWNARARFLYRGGAHWRDGFDPLLDWSHPDYPLLLPAFVARGWWFAGADTPLVPVLAHAAIGIGLVAVLIAAVGAANGPPAALMAGAALVATPRAVAMAVSQQADVPLSLFMLGTFAAWTIGDAVADSTGRASTARTSLLAGILAGLAAWTKNEGLVFLLLAPAARLAFLAAAGRGVRAMAAEAGAFAIGAAPAVMAIAYLKLGVAPPNDIVHAGRLSDAIGQLGHGWRYAAMPRWIGETLAHLAVPVLVLVVAAAWLRVDLRPRSAPAAVRAAGAALVAMAAAYLVVYLITPLDLEAHVRFSAHRLAHQLWPLMLFVVFAHVRITPHPSPRRAPATAGAESAAGAV